MTNYLTCTSCGHPAIKMPPIDLSIDRAVCEHCKQTVGIMWVIEDEDGEEEVLSPTEDMGLLH